MRGLLNLYRTMQRGLLDAKAEAPVRRVRSLGSHPGAGAGLCTDPRRGCRQGPGTRQERRAEFSFFDPRVDVVSSLQEDASGRSNSHTSFQLLKQLSVWERNSYLVENLGSFQALPGGLYVPQCLCEWAWLGWVKL